MGVTGRIDGPDFRPSGTSVIWDVGHLGQHLSETILTKTTLRPAVEKGKVMRNIFGLVWQLFLLFNMQTNAENLCI